MTSARNHILARLKAAQDNRGEIGEILPDFTSPVYHAVSSSPAIDFKINLEAIGGQVYICENKSELTERLVSMCLELNQDSVFCTDPTLISLFGQCLNIHSEEKDFSEVSIGITRCEYLVAHLGSVLVSSAQVSGRRLNVFPETHIVVADQSQLTNYLEEALEKLQKKYKNELPSLISTITGPSRTADIEKTLVMGMHGPRSLVVLISEETI